MTLLQKIQFQWRLHTATRGSNAPTASAAGVNIKIMGEILRAERPIPACVWEYFIANKECK